MIDFNCETLIYVVQHRPFNLELWMYVAFIRYVCMYVLLIFSFKVYVEHVCTCTYVNVVWKNECTGLLQLIHICTLYCLILPHIASYMYLICMYIPNRAIWTN